MLLIWRSFLVSRKEFFRGTENKFSAAAKSFILNSQIPYTNIDYKIRLTVIQLVACTVACTSTKITREQKNISDNKIEKVTFEADRHMQRGDRKDTWSRFNH